MASKPTVGGREGTTWQVRWKRCPGEEGIQQLPDPGHGNGGGKGELIFSWTKILKKSEIWPRSETSQRALSPRLWSSRVFQLPHPMPWPSRKALVSSFSLSPHWIGKVPRAMGQRREHRLQTSVGSPGRRGQAGALPSLDLQGPPLSKRPWALAAETRGGTLGGRPWGASRTHTHTHSTFQLCSVSV